MTSDPKTTTDGPDAPAADPPVPDAPGPDALTPDADAEGTPAPVAEEAPPRSLADEARSRDADAAAAAAALLADDAGAEAPPADAAALASAAAAAAEREYQEAMKTARALGLDQEAPTAEIDKEAASAERLAEQLGLDESADDVKPAPEPTQAADEKLLAAETDEILGPDAGDGRAWYVLNTYSGHENKVDENLKRRVESMDVADRIFDVVVPTEEELQIRGGQRRQVQRKLLPGYVLVNMILDDDTWYVVRNTPGVTGFVGADKPHPLPRQEVAAILKQTRVAEPRVRVGFEVGDMVRVMEGPFQDFTGGVDEINIDKGKVRVMISMFGRDTPVELDFMQVEKV